MVDRIRPLKFEDPASGGTQTDDFPTGTNPNEDFVDARGLTIQNDSSDDESVIVSRDASDNLTFQDGVVSGVKTLTDLLATGTGMTEATHQALNTLLHDLDKDYYEETTYAGGSVTYIITWTTAGKTLKVREYQYTYSGVKVDTETIIQYDGAGAEEERLTLTYAYTGNKLASVTSVRT